MSLDGRYAPSPSGPQHLGNLRTAMLAWLFARSQGARFLVRIDDLDRQRCDERWAGRQLAELAAIGVDWDGEPVRQSERDVLYAEALAALERAGLTYECFCTRREIREAASAPHGPLPEGFYPGTCRELSDRERGERRASGRVPAIRVRGGSAEIAFADRLHGELRGPVDDFVLRRNDGTHGYNLAVVVDDASQRVGEIVRGADLRDSTPRHIWLAGQLGLSAPRSWAHVPLLLGPDGDRLAKRHGAVTLAERAGAGESPDRVRGLLAASLGLCEPGEDPSPAELLQRFDPDRLPRRDQRIDELGFARAPKP